MTDALHSNGLTRDALQKLSNADKEVYFPEIRPAQLKGYITEFLKDEKGDGWIEAFIKKDAALREQGSDRPTLTAVDELLTYQGLHAISAHHHAHALFKKAQAQKADGFRPEAARMLVEARRISQGARRLTSGIEIHPGAEIGKRFIIDHGSGVIIGATCEIGDDVFLYHGVTLGATGKWDRHGRRHPKLMNGVEVNSEAQILGPVILGEGVSVGAGAKVVGNVIVGKGAKIGVGAEISGNVVIDEGAIIEAGAKVVSERPNGTEPITLPVSQPVVIAQGVAVRPDEEFVDPRLPDPKNKSNLPRLHIGKRATVRSEVAVRQSVPDGAVVVGTVPEIPGVLENPKLIGQPLIHGKGLPGNEVATPFWNGVVDAIRKLMPEGINLQ